MSLKKLEEEIGIPVDLACSILGDTRAITLDENFHKACKLGLRAIRELQQLKEENAKPKSQQPE